MTKEPAIPVRRRRSVRSAPIEGRIHPPPSASASWTAFERALASAISDLDEDEFLVVERKNTNYFVQFAALGFFGLRVEAAANVYQQRANRIPESAVQHLTHMGWKSPKYVQTHEHSEPVDGSPNFYLDVTDPIPYDVVSALAVETLRGPFATRHPGELQYEGYSDRLTSIRFPQLGIKRRVSVLKAVVAGSLADIDDAPPRLIMPAATAVC